jgi:xylulokinase
MLSRSTTVAKRSASALSARNASSFLGLDCSTQGLKATVINEDKEVVFNTAINFSKDLPQFGTENGVMDRGGGVVNSPTLMFVAALDKVFGDMQAADFDFGSVAAVSGSGQQHGRVYWAKVGDTVSPPPNLR